MAESQTQHAATSAFFAAHLATLTAAAQHAPVLDLACGRGRHSIAAARAGLHVIAVDRCRSHLDELAAVEIFGPGSIEVVELDLETGEPWQLGVARFGGIIVSRYLHRPLAPRIEKALVVGGVLVYETFTTAQRDLGWGPRRDDFLLRPDELPGLFPNLEVWVHEQGPSADDPPAASARLLARRGSDAIR